MKKEKKDTKDKKNIKFNGLLIIFISLILLLLTLYFYEHNKVAIDANEYFRAFISLFTNIFITAITLGGGTVLYGYFDFVNYIKEQISSVIIEDDFINALSSEKQAEIRKKIEKKEIFKGRADLENSLYDFVNTEVKELSRKTFFEEYSVHTYCSIQDNMIYKQFIKTFTINYKGTPDFKIDLKYLTHCTFKSYNKSDDFQPLTINELLVNGKNITDKIKYCLTDTNDKLYNKQCYYAFKNEKDMQASTYSSDKITVCLKYVTFVEADDKLLTQRVYMPCKSFEYIFSYDPKIFNAIAEPFSFKDVLVEEACINKEKIKIIYTDNCIHVKMNDWILPGDGVIFLIDKV